MAETVPAVQMAHHKASKPVASAEVATKKAGVSKAGVSWRGLP